MPPAFLRRLLAIARTTVRDLGGECAGLLLVLGAALLLLGTGESRGLDEAESAGVETLGGLSRALGFAVFGGVIVTAWSLDRDRRQGRWAWWSATPMRSVEYALGKWLGTVLVCTAVCTLLTLPWLLQDRRGERVLAPLKRVQADVLFTGIRGEELQRRALGPVLLGDVRARAIYEFQSLPVGGGRLVEVAAVPRNFERRDGPGDTMVRVVDAEGNKLAEKAMPDSRGPIRLQLPATIELPLRVLIKPGPFQRVVFSARGGLRLHPEAVVLLGEPTPSWWTLCRWIGGLFVLCAASCALTVACAAAMAEVFAVAASTFLLVLSASRDFLLEISVSIADPRSQARDWVRDCAGAVQWPLRVLPDLGGWVQLRERAAGVPVAGPMDFPVWGPAGCTALCLLVATLVLARVRGRP